MSGRRSRRDVLNTSAKTGSAVFNLKMMSEEDGWFHLLRPSLTGPARGGTICFIIIFIDMSACIKLNGKSVPCKDVLSIMLVCVSDELFSEFTYRDFVPCYHTVRVLVPRKKAYRLEVAVRKAQNK